MIESNITRVAKSAEARHSIPTVRALGNKTEAIRRGEVQRAIRKLGWHNGSDSASVIEAMSQSIEKKLIARFIACANRDSNNAQIVSRVFGVDLD